MQQPVPHDLKDIDEQILVALADGRNVPSNLAEALDVSRQWINTRLQQMESADYVRNVGRGVYELNPDEIPQADSERLGLHETHTLRGGCAHGDIAGARDALDRALAELPEDAPGRTAVEDARRLLETDG